MSEKNSKIIFVYLTAFLAGFLIMSLELLGFRLLAPYFGYSIYVFSSLLGLILFSLSFGYLIGGYLSKRDLGVEKFLYILLGASIYLVLMFAGYKFVLETFSKFDVVLGSLLATTVIFFIPMTVLATLSPFLVKLLSSQLKDGVGLAAGTIYAVSTAGSLVGTFITALYFIPEWGTRGTFLFDSLLMLCAVVLALVRFRRSSAILVLLALILFRPAVSETKVIYETDSAYNYINVADYGSFWALRTDLRTQAIQTYKLKPNVSDVSFSKLYKLFSVPAELFKPRQALLLGVAGGVIPAAHRDFSQNFPIDGVELDNEIIAVGRKYFHLSDLPNLTIHNQDARSFLKKAETYDLIEVDLFSGGAEISFYLSSQEFFAETARHLNPQGIMAMNIYDPSLGTIAKPLINTIASVYKEVVFVDLKTGSFFVLASNSDQIAKALAQKQNLEGELASLVSYFKQNARVAKFDDSLPVFTDDKTSIEILSYRALLRD